jgi:hypothetical protein
VPYLAKRLTYASTVNPKLAPPVPQNLLGSLRRLYYKTAMSANPSTLIALASFVSTDRILFGADYPFMPESETAETIAGLGEFFGPPALANIEQNNAAALVPRLAAIAPSETPLTLRRGEQITPIWTPSRLQRRAISPVQLDDMHRARLS